MAKKPSFSASRRLTSCFRLQPRWSSPSSLISHLTEGPTNAGPKGRLLTNLTVALARCPRGLVGYVLGPSHTPTQPQQGQSVHQLD